MCWAPDKYNYTKAKKENGVKKIKGVKWIAVKFLGVYDFNIVKDKGLKSK